MSENRKMTLEEALTKLESIEQKLEGGELTLDESMKQYEEAVSLIRLCTDLLAEADSRVRILCEGEDGTLTDRPFVQDEN